ncbi:Flagellar L-ring protein FlgH [Rhodovulum sp. P5]|uniref:flagellar basal body L-ring protein FlgH n=1 Tax=Rhodovulum sp. P5 TaxID=1564506 RepID=UPI0009C3D80D|nr:flagellar basal body L-ring protein FlgH [Rhodovulum sp. P5]ARE40405.1 Flagellar L-ring protein FlgH [Rhodovulum sp. P5]
MKPIIAAALTAVVLFPAGCADLKEVGKPPAFKPTAGTNEYYAMNAAGALPPEVERRGPVDNSSLWAAGKKSLLGDRRAGQRGDILTVVIELDEKAEMSNATDRSRSGSKSMGIAQLLGLPQNMLKKLPAGATMDPAIDTNADTSHSGDGSIKRKEKLTLRVAATVTQVLQNGVFQIEGTQEIRVNFELRELVVTGYVRPEDISRQNEITYDKIASARISYGGRGQITQMQQPAYGQQILDIVSPF